MQPSGQNIRVLVVVKTYPNPSQRYGETVCCAGIDMATRGWVRIYPVNFRRLAADKFNKYQVIECRASLNPKDHRPESRKVDQDSIRVQGKPLSTRDAWRERLAWLPALHASLERPLLDLEMRLGEGTGAALAIPIVQAATAALSRMATLDAVLSGSVAPGQQTA